MTNGATFHILYGDKLMHQRSRQEASNFVRLFSNTGNTFGNIIGDFPTGQIVHTTEKSSEGFSVGQIAEKACASTDEFESIFKSQTTSLINSISPSPKGGSISGSIPGENSFPKLAKFGRRTSPNTGQEAPTETRRRLC